MATGALDANGVWQYGEDDSEATFSALLNKASGSISTTFTAYKTASPRTVANSGARDALFPSPVQGNAVFRTDLGQIQRYYAAYNSSTNPGGRTPAGWYSGQDGGLVPIVPSSVVVGSGSATVAGNGTVTISGASSVSLNGVFSSNFTNYRVVFAATSSTAAASVYFKCRNAGSDITTTTYYNGGFFVYAAGTNGNNSSQAVSTGINVGYLAATSAAYYDLILDIFQPYAAKATGLHSQSMGYAASGIIGQWTHGLETTEATRDGFTLAPSAGNFSGSFTVYGYRI